MFQRMLFQAFVSQGYIFTNKSLYSCFNVNLLKVELLTEYMWTGFFLNLTLWVFMYFETVPLKYLKIYWHFYYLFKGISIQTPVNTVTMKVMKVQMESIIKFKDVMQCRFWTRTYISQLPKIRNSNAVKPSFIG